MFFKMDDMCHMWLYTWKSNTYIWCLKQNNILFIFVNNLGVFIKYEINNTHINNNKKKETAHSDRFY